MLTKGTNSVRSNMNELMTGAMGGVRTKAVNTIAGKHGISVADARFRQAIAISGAQAKRK